MITFSSIENFAQWLLRRPEPSGVKMDTIYDIYQISSIKSGPTLHADEDESCICPTREQDVTIDTVNNVNISTLENPVLTKNSEHNLNLILSERVKTSLSFWNECK